MDSILSKNKTNFIKQGKGPESMPAIPALCTPICSKLGKQAKVSLAFLRLTGCISGMLGKVSLAFMRLTSCISSMLGKVSLATLTARIRKLSLACVIIGTPGDGESTKPLSHATKTSLDQQFSERRPEFASRVWAHYTSPKFLSSGLFGGFTGSLFGGFTGSLSGVAIHSNRSFNTWLLPDACGMFAAPATAKAVTA